MEHQKTSLRASGQPEWGFVRASLYCTMESILGQRHRHKDFFQVFKVLEGEGEIEIGGETYRAGGGGVFWIPPNVWHSSHDPANQSPRIIEIRFVRNARLSSPFQVTKFPYHIDSDHLPGVLSSFHEIVKENTLRKPFWEWAASARLNEMIALLARAVERRSDAASQDHAGRYRIDGEAVERALNYMHLNYFHRIDLEVLSKVAGMSVSRLTKVFRALEGTTPIDYLIEYRLKRATQMMEDGRLTLTQIAESVGFNSIHHFSSCYKKRLGVSPSGHQRSQKLRQKPEPNHKWRTGPSEILPNGPA
jgi:AraC-like DNA-binding protein